MTWTTRNIILASQSPRRKEILQMIGLEFTIQTSTYEEDRIADKSPDELVVIHAIEKARDVASKVSDSLVIGADTIVIVDGQILEKPKNKTDAFEMLKKLSGKTHKVQTGVAIVNSKNDRYISFVETTEVSFFPLSDKMIMHYLQNYHYSDKAGSYAIQDYSGLFVERINGCFYNVVGFPISRFYQFMNQNYSKID